MKRALVLLSAALLAHASTSPTNAAPDAPRLELIATYVMGQGTAAEIVSVDAASQRAVLTDARGGYVDVIGLADPAKPRRVARHILATVPGEELTCVAMVPRGTWFLAVLRAADPKTPGRLLIVETLSGAIRAELPVGHGPDSVAVAPDGKTAVVANEAEAYWKDAASGAWRSMPGGVSIIDLAGGPKKASVTTFTLIDHTRTRGFTKAHHGRFLERTVSELDGGGEETVLIPLDTQRPMHLEPEYVAYAHNSRRAYVTLQENNGVIVVDVVKQRVVAAWGLGTTTHKADTDDDGQVAFTHTITALREPDGISVTPTGRFFVTADEGDTDPKAKKSTGRTLVGGGRTLSVFDALNGRFVGDTGNQIDAAAHAIGTYDDNRSDNKGTEPENVVTFRHARVTYAAVGLERAGAVALVSLARPRQPRVLGAFKLGEGSVAPEGMAVLRHQGAIYVLTANEISGDLSIFRFVP